MAKAPKAKPKTDNGAVSAGASREKGVLREKILETATMFFAKKGYIGCSMRDIAAVLNVTPASIYHHFQDKEALYREVCHWRFNLARETLSQALDETRSAKEQLMSFLEELVILLEGDEIYFRLVQMQLLERSVEETRLLSSGAFIPHYQFIQGLISKINPTLEHGRCAFNLYALALGYAHFKAMRTAFPDEIEIGQTPQEIAATIFETVLWAPGP